MEAKTGADPSFTPNPLAVYFYALPGGVSLPDAKIARLGFPLNQELPPFPIFLSYASGPNALDEYYGPLKSRSRN